MNFQVYPPQKQRTEIEKPNRFSSQRLVQFGLQTLEILSSTWHQQQQKTAQFLYVTKLLFLQDFPENCIQKHPRATYQAHFQSFEAAHSKQFTSTSSKNLEERLNSKTDFV